MGSTLLGTRVHASFCDAEVAEVNCLSLINVTKDESIVRLFLEVKKS
jgi:hypothetical protein